MKHTSSAPSFLTNSSFLHDAVTTTFAPRSLANWIAYAPTEVLPPLMNRVWPSSSFAKSSACSAAIATTVIPAASISVRLEGLLTIADSGVATYSDKAPCFVVRCCATPGKVVRHPQNEPGHGYSQGPTQPKTSSPSLNSPLPPGPTDTTVPEKSYSGT